MEENGPRMRVIRIKTASLLLLPVLWVPGCGSSTPTAGPNIAAAHGGNVLALPGGKGYVEFLVEAVGGAAKSKNQKSQAVAYFLKVDGSGPLDPAPSDVTFTPEGGSAVTLKPDGSGSKAGRFASEPGLTLLAGREVAGELSASVGGEVVKVTVLAR
jgi:hypothetical protein